MISRKWSTRRRVTWTSTTTSTSEEAEDWNKEDQTCFHFFQTEKSILQRGTGTFHYHHRSLNSNDKYARTKVEKKDTDVLLFPFLPPLRPLFFRNNEKSASYPPPISPDSFCFFTNTDMDLHKIIILLFFFQVSFWLVGR